MQDKRQIVNKIQTVLDPSLQMTAKPPTKQCDSLRRLPGPRYINPGRTGACDRYGNATGSSCGSIRMSCSIAPSRGDSLVPFPRSSDREWDGQLVTGTDNFCHGDRRGHYLS